MARLTGCAVLAKAFLLLSSIISAASLLPAATPAERSRRQASIVALHPHGSFLKVDDILRLQEAADHVQAPEQTQSLAQVQAPTLVSAPVSHSRVKSAVMRDVIGMTAVNAGSQITPLMRALKGGMAGMAAAFLQVICLMWLRTALNHQYYHGGSISDTFHTLWQEGGCRRFYQGLGFALVQKPLSRFGDTFVETAVVVFLGMPGQHLHGFSAGLIVATLGAFWRLCLAPLDAFVKTSQVHGASAGKIFSTRVQVSGLLELWSGASAMFLVTFISTLPWWSVYNTVLELYPDPPSFTARILRNGLAGVLASIISDVVSNSLRVLQVKRQATLEGSIGAEGYFADARDVVMKDGTTGLLFRGIYLRLLTGALQGAFFSILWNLLAGQTMSGAH